MRDLASNISVSMSLIPATQSATAKGTAVDLLGFDSAALVITTGAIVSSGLYVMSLQESATTTDGDFTDVAASNVVGTLPTSLAASSSYKVSYVGTKRYVRAVITKTSGTSIDAGAAFILGHATQRPVA